MEQSLSPTYLKFEMLEWHLLLTLSRRLRLQRERESAPVCLPIPSGLGFSEFGGYAFRYTLL